MRKILPIFILILFGCKSNKSVVIKDSIQIDSLKNFNVGWNYKGIEGSRLLFDNGNIYETNLFMLDFIGQIANGDRDPFLIYSGVDCDSCDADISIYIHSPNDGTLNVKSGQNRYGYPGKEYDLYNDSLIYEGQAYYGEVLPNTKGVIWYQKELIEKGSWNSSIFLADVTSGSIIDTFLNDKGQLNQTLSLLKEGKCLEIAGHIYRSTP